MLAVYLMSRGESMNNGEYRSQNQGDSASRRRPATLDMPSGFAQVGADTQVRPVVGTHGDPLPRCHAARLPVKRIVTSNVTSRPRDSAGERKDVPLVQLLDDRH